MTRILITDDRESMRIALRALIRMRPDWQICGEAEDGREVEISSSMPTIPIVMYTLYRTPELEVAAKLVGIRQVIAKEDGGKCLLRAIETELLAKNSPQ